jgi:outer membrane protein assembly factor BamD
MRKKSPIIFIIAIVALFSCSKKKEEKTNAELDYTKAYNSLKERDFNKAAEDFEKIDDSYPFSKWAIKGKTMAVYARYKNGEHDKVMDIVDDFTRLNPTSEYIPYMIYMKGLSYYEQIPSIERSQESTQQASFTFRELIARFPQSEYAQDSKDKLEFIDEHLAGYKMALGRYQMKQENYIAAIAIFHEVIDRYRSSKQVAEALFRLSEVYLKIGIINEANKSRIELENRFPNSYWATEIKKIHHQ